MNERKERPILFSAPMVCAILEGRKTQTRRIVKHPIDWGKQGAWNVKSPYGQPGDRLWVRETWSAPYRYAEKKPRDMGGPCWYWADGNPTDGDWTRPIVSIYMPRWASRITLELTGARVERLGAITEADARAEGIFHNGLGWVSDKGQPVSATAVRAYEDLWYSINGSWLPETWVWVLEFRRVSA